MDSEMALTRCEWEERMLEISRNLRNARWGILIALVGLLTCACLVAAPGPKQDSQTAEVKDGQVLMVAASIPHFPLLGTPGCLGQSPCQGFDVLEKQMLELLTLDRLNPANRAETGGHALPLHGTPSWLKSPWLIPGIWRCITISVTWTRTVNLRSSASIKWEFNGDRWGRILPRTKRSYARSLLS